MFKKFLNEKNKKWFLLAIGLVVAGIVTYVVITMSTSDKIDNSDPAYNLTRVFNALGTKTTIEGYQDERYNMLLDITTNMLGEQPSLCYTSPVSDLEKNANASQIVKQAIRLGLQNKQYYDIAAISILYLSIISDIEPEDFEIIKNKKGIVKWIKMKNPDDATKFLTTGEFMNLLLKTINPNVSFITSPPNFTFPTTPAAELNFVPDSTDDDYKEINAIALQRLNEILSELNAEDKTNTKINIVTFSKVIALSISSSLYPDKCSISKPPKTVVGINGKKNRPSIVFPTNFTMPPLRYRKSKNEEDMKIKRDEQKGRRN